MPRADLGTIQHQVWDLITAPEGVVQGAADLAARGEIPGTDLSFLVRGDERLAPEERLDIYANMYFYRLRDCLAEDFPCVSAVLGGARFHNLVTDYLLAHPSSTWTLRRLGERLPAFLAGHAAGKGMPFLGDLARLEWARIEAFDAPDARPLERADLAAMQEAGVASRRLGLVPSARILDLDWSIAPLWREAADQAGEGIMAGTHSAAVGGDSHEHFAPPLQVAQPAKRPAHVLVWRGGFQVFHRTVAPDERACLGEIRDRGATLPRLCEVILASMSVDESRHAAEVSSEAARRTAGIAGAWLADGLLIEIRPEP